MLCLSACFQRCPWFPLHESHSQRFPTYSCSDTTGVAYGLPDRQVGYSLFFAHVVLKRWISALPLLFLVWVMFTKILSMVIMVCCCRPYTSTTGPAGMTEAPVVLVNPEPLWHCLPFYNIRNIHLCKMKCRLQICVQSIHSVPEPCHLVFCRTHLRVHIPQAVSTGLDWETTAALGHMMICCRSIIGGFFMLVRTIVKIYCV